MISALLTEIGTISAISHELPPKKNRCYYWKKIRSLKYLKASLSMINTLLRMHMMNSASVTSVLLLLRCMRHPWYSAAVLWELNSGKEAKELQAVPSVRWLNQRSAVVSQREFLHTTSGANSPQGTAGQPEMARSQQRRGPCPRALGAGAMLEEQAGGLGAGSAERRVCREASPLGVLLQLGRVSCSFQKYKE